MATLDHPLFARLRLGRGRVPPIGSLAAAAWKELLELPAVSTCAALTPGAGANLDFSDGGVSFEQFRGFLEEAAGAAKKVEQIVETGNKYGVAQGISKLNGELLLHEIRQSANFRALRGKDQARANDFFAFWCFNDDLRSRNPLHPNPLDSAIIGNLLNFQKHLFGFPFASFSTDGYESLSLVLFSYRQRCAASSPCVLYATHKAEQVPIDDIRACAQRLGMELSVVGSDNLPAACSVRPAVVMLGLANPAFDEVTAWAQEGKVDVHIHVWDTELRNVLTSSPMPVHFEMPLAVRSMTVHSGLFRAGYQLYRDLELRDLHVDVPSDWQVAYVSTNEGGSGSSTPLLIDFSFILLGWLALRDMAAAPGDTVPERWLPVMLAPEPLGGNAPTRPNPIPEGISSADNLLAWGRERMELPQGVLEEHLVAFMRNFLGGKRRDLEAFVTAGGTRSITAVFESVLVRAEEALGSEAQIKVITGNPHLAVGRAERRLQFQLVRVVKDGTLSVAGLKEEITDPLVAAVYMQTLSFTDGITDPLREIIEVVELENIRRQSLKMLPVTIINDSCLALSVLLHHDGSDGRPSLRVLDVTEQMITPTVVMLDPHKHIGADKGMSVAVGTVGTLSHLSGKLRVGSRPSGGETVRAWADGLLVGVDGYIQKYRELGSAVASTVAAFEDVGLKAIHGCNRITGSTVVSIEDPSGVMGRRLKKLGHGPMVVYDACPSDPSRCQSGFQMSFTLRCLREVKEGSSALDVFTRDVIAVHKKVSATYSPVARRLRESSLPAILLAGGNLDVWLCSCFNKPGRMREVASVLTRALYWGILDSGIPCSDRNLKPLRDRKSVV